MDASCTLLGCILSLPAHAFLLTLPLLASLQKLRMGMVFSASFPGRQTVLHLL